MTVQVQPPTRSRNRPRPPHGGSTAIRDALAALNRASFVAREGRCHRVALAFATRRGGPAGDAAVALDDVAMMALSSRFCATADGGIRYRIPLAFYRAVVDLPGTGRVDFVLDASAPAAPPAVFDAAARSGTAGVRRINAAAHPARAAAALALAEAADDAEPADCLMRPALPKFYWAFRSRTSPRFEARYSPREWAAAEVRIGVMRAWPAAMFVRGVADRYDVHPGDGTAAPASDPGGDAEDGGWAHRDGVWYPRAQEPDAIYTYLDDDGGRTVRNPAFAVLRGHGLIADDYRQWRGTLGPHRRGGRRHGRGRGPGVADPHQDATRPGRLRAAIEAYATADPRRERALLDDLAAACAALGVAAADDDALYDLLMSPWEPQAAAGGAIQVVALTGPPAPETMDFGTDAVEPVATARLYDLGAPYDVLPARLVEEARGQCRKKAAPPSWNQPPQRRPSA